MRYRGLSASIAVAVIVLLVPGGVEAKKRRHRRPVELHDCGDAFVGAAPSGFTVSLATDKAQYARGEPVALVLTVTNDSGRVYSQWVGLPDAVFGVFKDDKLIWSSSYAMAYPAIALEETFASGEQKSASAIWQQDLCRTDGAGGVGTLAFVPGPPPAGTYSAQAAWRGQWASNIASFTITRLS